VIVIRTVEIPQSLSENQSFKVTIQSNSDDDDDAYRNDENDDEMVVMMTMMVVVLTTMMMMMMVTMALTMMVMLIDRYVDKQQMSRYHDSIIVSCVSYSENTFSHLLISLLDGLSCLVDNHAS